MPGLWLQCVGPPPRNHVGNALAAGNECLPGAHACLPCHAGEEEWDEGRIAPYQVRLWPEGADGSGEYDGMMIFAPVAGWVWHPGEGAGLEETLGSPAHDQYGPRGPPY